MNVKRWSVNPGRGYFRLSFADPGFTGIKLTKIVFSS